MVRLALSTANREAWRVAPATREQAACPTGRSGPATGAAGGSRRAAPHPALRPFLRSYDGYWETEAVPTRMRTLPTRTTVVIVNLGPPLRLAVPDPGVRDREYGSFVAGMHDGHGMYLSPGGQRGIQLDVTPLGAYTLLGVPMGLLANTAVELPDLLGREAAALVERLADAPSWGARFAILDGFLLRRLDAAPSRTGRSSGRGGCSTRIPRCPSPASPPTSAGAAST
ncbi:hypothetical protein LUX57_00920 [Actinomadura madurae]|uniref:hypothetical protein n=1 Tax=Actinomadura madurae TaxID=1993 RepID=UPI0020D1FFA4|nr:hypothetical protein [Actinomadura madurae]MCP9963919.1 hypothetical protein [Actinomadura madurae]